MTRATTEVELDEYGHEVHPSWALLGASRVSSTGTTLFDSDIVHQHSVVIKLMQATRQRSLHTDYIHGTKTVAEVELSQAQWAAFVSTMNSGDGVPCTMRWVDGAYVPEAPHAPRLAETMAETHRAARAAFDDIKAAFKAVEAATTAREKREAMHTLEARINNATPNVDFAGKQLVQQAEDVVQKSKADIEAYVVATAHRLGVDPASVRELPAGMDQS